MKTGEVVTIITLMYLFIIRVSTGSRLCLIPTKVLTPWTRLAPRDIICPMNEIQLSQTSSAPSSTTVDLDTTDVFSEKKIMGTSSTLMQFETCCVNNPLWMSDEITHKSQIIESSTFQEVSEGIPTHPDPACKRDMLSKTVNCESRVFKIDKQDFIHYSPIHGFPHNLDCDISPSGIITCKNKLRHSTFVGTFPSVPGKSKNCPIKWTKTDIIIHKEGTEHYVDYKDIRLARSKVVCKLEICDKTWVGLSLGLLILAPSSVVSPMSLAKCGTKFNYAFDITASQHEEIKTGLKELKTNDRCELLKQSEDDLEILTFLILEWNTFYPQRPGVHQSYRVDGKVVYYSNQLFELVNETEIYDPLVWDTCTICGIRMENGSLHIKGSVLNKNVSTLIRLACSESIDLITAIKIKENLKDLFIQGTTGDFE
ncbi:Hypothetical protein CINCED_3A005157 [Cinara cedri]|uniref:Uncharacterized protein n=1 Tax=Cinara cedri TaxID=506608 RepID=A0A5E4NMY1_9HEMI|nr:Hypothetical protein CINCED_3A005157 [Cinara cedri]